MAAEGMDVDGKPQDEVEDAEGDMEIEEPAETDEEREARAVALKAEGNKKYVAKEYSAALNLYTQAITAFPRPEFYGNRAACYIAMGKFKEGLSDCHSALELDSNFRKAYIRGIKCYTELADFKGAQRFAQTGLDKFPNDKDLKQGFDRVEILRAKLQRIDDKLNCVSLKYDSLFESHLNPSPHSNTDEDEKKENESNDLNEETVLHRLSKDDEKEVNTALSMISSLMRNDLSQSVSLKCTNIRALIIKQNYDGALSTATNVLRWNKDNIEVTKLRAIALFRNGQTDSAIKHLQQILRKDPDNKECRTMFKLFKSIGRAKDAGNRAFKAGQLEEAITKYTECLSLDKTNLKFNCVIYANRAAVWLKQKQWQKAFNDCTAAIGLDSDYIKAYNRRVQALYKLERFDEAVGDAEKALNLDPSSNELKQQVREAQIELKKSKRKNYYKILGVEKEATDKEIKKAFRKKAMLWHPDKFASATEEEKKAAEEKFKEIGEAYEVLKDETMRKRYDAGVDPDNLKNGGGFPGGMHGMDMSHIFDLLGGMHGGGRGGMPGGFQFHGGQGGGAQQFHFRFG